MFNSLCNKKGITIIEVVLTLFLTAVGIMALLSMQPISWQTAGRSDFMGRAAGVLQSEVYQSNTRFSLYRWHIMDPVRFKQDLAVTIQALGWRSGGRYLPNQDDIASVAFWYQTEPHAAFPALPGRYQLEII